MINENKAKTGKRISELREKAGYKTIEKFADELGYSRQTVAKWENGNTMPTLDQLCDIVSLLECDIGYLLCLYDTRYFEHADICKTTGLSEDAVKVLVENQCETNNLKLKEAEAIKKCEERLSAPWPVKAKWLNENLTHSMPEQLKKELSSSTFLRTRADIISHIITNSDELLLLIARYNNKVRMRQYLQSLSHYSEILRVYRYVLSLHDDLLPPYDVLKEMFVQEFERIMGHPVENAEYYFRLISETEDIEGIEYAISREFLRIIEEYAAEGHEIER